MILFSVAGAVAATYLQRYFIIVVTAFGGAWTMIVGAMALVGDRTALRAATSGDVWVAYPLNPAPGQRWVPIVWIVLSLIGAGVQLGITGGEKGQSGEAEEEELNPDPKPQILKPQIPSVDALGFGSWELGVDLRQNSSRNPSCAVRGLSATISFMKLAELRAPVGLPKLLWFVRL